MSKRTPSENAVEFKFEEGLQMTSIESLSESEATATVPELQQSNDVGAKPMPAWTQMDFLDKPDGANDGIVSKHVNRMFQCYSNVRQKLLGSAKSRQDEDEISCDGIQGLCILIAMAILDAAYVGYCIYVSNLKTEDDIRLVVMSVILWIVLLWKIMRRVVRLDRRVACCCGCASTLADKLHTSLRSLRIKKRVLRSLASSEHSAQKRLDRIIQWIGIAAMLGFTIFCLVQFVILENLYNLVSLSGIVLLLFGCIIISVHPDKIIWQPVYVGLFIQLTFAVITLQTYPGYQAFDWLGKRMAEFLKNSNYGAIFVFGPNFADHYFAFAVLPVVVFFSSFITVAFHLGIIQLVITKPSALIRKAMGTTAPETVNAIANIFVGMTEAPMITRPYMHMMTNSELHAIFVNGFASVAGSVMAAFIGFGVPANHLLIACVMSAPAALAVSKIIYPETKISPLVSYSEINAIKTPYLNVLEAAMVGAMDAIPIVAGIAANLIAFLSLYSFFNRTLMWLGYRAGMLYDLTFEVIFSYLLWPVAFTMGIPVADCSKVAELIGIKLMLNEFVAFERLGIIMKNSAFLKSISELQPQLTKFVNGSYLVQYNQNGTALEIMLPYGLLTTKRAEVISTYALCGFANIGSIGIMLGAMTAMIPARRKDLSSLALRSFIGGTTACFLTGCFAGLFYKENQ